MAERAWQISSVESGEEEMYPAGSRAPAGRYARVDARMGRGLTLDREDWLPASLDGRVALYRRLPAQIALRRIGAPWRRR